MLEVLLLLAGRQHIVAAQKLVDVRNKLAETVEQIDTLMGKGNRTHSALRRAATYAPSVLLDRGQGVVERSI